MFNSLTSVVRFIRARPGCQVELIETSVGADDGYRVIVNGSAVAYLDTYASEQLYGLVTVRVMR